jgi:hypothetical protein
MAVRSTMAALIARTRLLINDPSSPTQAFADQDIQDILDESRVDVINGSTIAKPTFSGSTVQYLNYFTDAGGWEDGFVLKQYLTVIVTPSVLEPIAGRFQFAASTLPPLFITGSLHDIYRASADLLERLAARWVLRYSMTVDGQNLQRGQVTKHLTDLAKTYRMKQRPRMMQAYRSDIAHGDAANSAVLNLAPIAIDMFGSGDGR